MTITYDERQRILEMLKDGNCSKMSLPEIFQAVWKMVPQASVDDVHNVVEENVSRMKEQIAGLREVLAATEFIDSVVQRDPDLSAIDPDLSAIDPVFDAIPRLAARGDKDAQRILAVYASPVRRAIEHIVYAAVDSACDWIREGHIIRPLEGGRGLHQVIEDLLDQAGFDPMTLLPDELRTEVNPLTLTLGLNDLILDSDLPPSFVPFASLVRSMCLASGDWP